MSFSLVKQMLARRLAAKEPSGLLSYPLQGAGRPLDHLRIGGIMDLSPAFATFVTAASSGSFVVAPAAALITEAYGNIRDSGFLVHRFYSGDYFFQVITDQAKRVVEGEVKLFQKLAEVNPSTPEEWDLWTKGTDGNQPLLTGPTITWQDRAEFTRVWSPGLAAAEAKTWFEDTEVGQSAPASTTQMSAMLFSRSLSSGQTEWLQLSSCRSGSERWIEAYVGLFLETGEILTT